MARLFLLISFLLLLSTGIVYAETNATIDLNPNLPGVTYPATVGPIGTVANFFQTGLLVGGLLAFGAIVYGAIRYSLSAGSSSGQGDAKDQITQAILGLLLLLFAFLILQFLNPGLTVLSLPKLDKLEIQANSGGGGGGGGGGYPNNRCLDGSCPPNGCASGTCQPLSSIGLSCSNTGCTADPQMIRSLTCLKNKGVPGFTITAGYPPNSHHQDRKHYNGCAVDIVVSNFNNCGQVSSIINAASQCGLSPGNEYLNCGGHPTDLQRGNNIHLDGC